MAIEVLGPLRVTRDDPGDRGGPAGSRLGGRDRIVLAALVASAGAGVPPGDLAEAVWGVTPPETWRKALQGCISRLRRTLGDAAIETTAQGYRLAVPRAETDAGRFEEQLARAEESMRLGEPHRAAYTTEQALALWRGRPLAEVEDWPPGRTEADRLGELRLSAEELHLEALLAAGDRHDLIALAQRLVDAEPARERRWCALALAHYRGDDQTRALATLRDLRARLIDELGVEPGPAALALQQAILRQDPALVAERSVDEPTGRCPYPGLRPFETSEADSFFGRDADVERCVARLRADGVLAVVGPSGIGKSSVVRAGVAAAWGRLGRRCHILVPGREPLAALAALHPAPGPGDLLVVDQAEELYVACEDVEQRRRFWDAVVAHAEHGPLVVALRADRMGDVQGEPRVARLVERGLFLLGGLDRQGLRSAIAHPAAGEGLIVEPGLVDLLVREVEGEPGALPMLSHVLGEVWQRREGRTLTLAGYHASGGITGAVARSAEAMFGRVPDADRPKLRDLMLRLVAPGIEGDPVPARLPRRLVVADATHDRLVDLLIETRLVTSNDGRVELAHESLVRAWPRLRDWLADDVEGRRIMHHLVTAADDWQALGRPDSELYRGVRLSRALAWRAESGRELTTAERDFLDAGARAADVEQVTAEERVRAQDRMIRRLRVALVAGAALLAIAMLAGRFAVVQRDNAQTAAATAADSETAAVAQRVGAQALATDDVPTALLLATAAARLDPAPAVQGRLQQVLAEYPSLVRLGYVEGAVGGLAASPDGGAVAVVTTAGRLTVLDRSTLEVTATATVGAGGQVFPGAPVAYAPDGRTLAVGAMPNDDLPVRLLDPETLDPLPRQLTGFPAGVSRGDAISYSEDGGRVAVAVDYPGPDPDRAASGVDAAEQRTMVLVWDVARPERPIRRLVVPGVQGVQLSPDGRTFYLGSPFAAYDVATGRRLVTNPDVYSFIFFDVDPSGRRLIMLPYGEGGVDPLVVDAGTGRISARLSGLEGINIFTVAWAPSGERVAGTAQDGSVVVWDAATGEVQRSIENQDAATYGLAFSPDASTLYTAGANGQVAAWDLDGYRSFLRRVRVEESPLLQGGSFVEPAPDARVIAYSQGGFDDDHHEVSFVGVGVGVGGGFGERVGPVVFPDRDWFGAGAWSPDDSRFATGFGAGMVRVVDPTSGDLVASRSTGPGLVTEVAFTDDGDRLVVASKNGDVRLLDATDLKPTHPPVHFTEPVLSVAANPAGSTALAVLGGPAREWFEDYAAREWALIDTETGAVVRRGGLGLDGAEYAAFSPDGVHAVVVGRQSQFVVLDTDTGEAVVGPSGRQRGTMRWVAFDHDGARFVTGSDDRSLRLWDAATGAAIGVVRLPRGTAFGGFRTDGTLVATSPAGPVYLWDPSIAAATDFACRVVGRTLSPGAWRAAFGDQRFADACPGAPPLGEEWPGE